MSIELHRQAEHFMCQMDRAKSRGDWLAASAAAEQAALFEDQALVELRAKVPDRVRTIALIEESDRALHDLARQYQARQVLVDQGTS